MYYGPLGKNEIRVLTILPEANGLPKVDGPIRCSLEHVSFKPPTNLTLPASDFLHQQDVRKWPEADIKCDFAVLFKNKKHRLATIPSCTAVPEPAESSSDIVVNNHPPWRYDWGDYLALSYVWGPATLKRHIILNDLRFAVTDNLYHALHQLRSCRRMHEGFKLWVDAICINQDDVQERSEQVARMRDIYTFAWQVVIWLGPEANHSDLAFTALRWLAKLKEEKDLFKAFYRVGTTVNLKMHQ